jgi:hypothetical protein
MNQQTKIITVSKNIIYKTIDNRFFKYIYLLIIVFLLVVQYIYSFKTAHFVRFEELQESILGVYHLQQKTVLGINCNVGWYAPILILYNLFGLNLDIPKYYRLFLHLASLICLTKILLLYFGHKRAWLPLLVFGLSPTLLFYNSLRTSMGIDLQYFPICLSYILKSSATLVPFFK